MGKNGTAYILMEEQETIIQFSRIDDYATICTSDTTEKTKLRKLIENNPKHWKLISDDNIFLVCTCTPKSLISYRSKKVERTLTPEHIALMQASRNK